MRRCLVLLLLVSVRLSAAQSNYGGASEAFPLLNKGAGARPAAMGSAFEALAEDSAGVHFNPAGQGFATHWELGLHHDAWLANTSRENLVLLAPMGNLGGFSAQGAIVSYPSLELRDSSGTLLGEFRPAEQAVGLGWGRAFSPTLSLGLGLRGLRQELPGSSSQDYSWSLGTLWKSGNGLGLAAVLRSLPQSGMAGSSHFFRYSLAAAYSSSDLISGPLNAALSMNLDPSSPAELKLGIEKGFKAASALSLRAGYGAFFPSYNLGPLHGLSAGAGLRLGGFVLDYAFLPFGSLGSTHQVSLSWRFESSPENPAEMVRGQAAANSVTLSNGGAVAGQLPVSDSKGEQFRALPPELETSPSAPAAAAHEAQALNYRVLTDGYVRAKKLEDEGNAPAAVKAYVQAVKDEPHDLPSWRALAEIYEHLGKPEWAARCRREAKKLESVTAP